MPDQIIQDFCIRESSGQGDEFCPSVCDYVAYLEGHLHICGVDRLITPLPDIQICFSYPLKRPVTFSYHQDRGFTLSSFWCIVHHGYSKIYKEEDDSLRPLYQHSHRYDRVTMRGKYGILGHVLEELMFEGFIEERAGEFSLAIGS
jgi:hypothetical protein